jgi:ATP-binding cassette subfamily B protein
MFQEESIEESSERIRYAKIAARLWELVKRHRAYFLLAAAYIAGSSLTKLIGPMLLRNAIDIDIPSGNYMRLLGTLGLFLLNALLFLFFTYQMSVQLERLAQAVMLDLKKHMVDHLLGLHLGYFDRTPVGKITARIQSDTDTMHNLFVSMPVTALRDSVVLAGTLAIMIHYNAKLTLVTVSLSPLLFVGMTLFIKKSAKYYMASRKLNSELSGFMTEKINGIVAVQSFNRENQTDGQLKVLNERKFKAQFTADFMGNLFFMIGVVMQPVTTAMVLGFGGVWILQGKATVGIVVMFMLYMDQLFEPLMTISEQITVVQSSFAAAQRIFTVIDLKSEIREPAKPRYINRMERELSFDDVWLKYADESPWALRGVSFKVPRGSRCAIVGATGSGKTSIISMLFKFYLPQKGAISVDGINILDIPQTSIRSMMGLVQQDIYLFPGTLMDNLKLMDTSVPDERVYSAIREMGLEDFFRRHDLKKVITEGGSNLSTGEKQVVSIVRAMVMDPPLLVLDEATSAVDPHTERLIQKATDRLFKDRTCVIIAHRLSTIKNADNIIVLGDGEMKEHGSHDALMERDGIYAKYFRLQFSQV